MSERAVRIILPTINMMTHLPKISTRKRRVAAYARVSTDSEEQLTSYEAQVDYYTNYIQKNPITIGKAFRLSPPFPPSHTVRATFTAHGVLSTKILIITYTTST